MRQKNNNLRIHYPKNMIFLLPIEFFYHHTNTVRNYFYQKGDFL